MTLWVCMIFGIFGFWLAGFGGWSLVFGAGAGVIGTVAVLAWCDWHRGHWERKLDRRWAERRR